MPASPHRVLTRFLLVPLLLVCAVIVETGAFAAPNQGSTAGITMQGKEPPKQNAAPAEAPAKAPPARSSAPDNVLTFANTSAITINDQAKATPYPSNIVISG